MIKACVTGGIANMIWGIELGVVPVEDSEMSLRPRYHESETQQAT